MGEVKKINDEYYIEFFARGLKYQQKAGADQVKAEELLRTIEDKIAKGEEALIVRDVDIDIFFHDFGEFAVKNYTPKTAQRYQATGEHFFSFLKTKLPTLLKLSQITPHVIEQYKAYLLKISDKRNRRLKPKTVNLTLLLMNDILDYARKLGYLNDNPAIHTPLIRVEFERKRSLIEKDLHGILHKIPEHLCLIIEAIMYSGITLQELINLKWEHIDWERKTMKIINPDHAGCLRLPRVIPLHPKLFETLNTLHSKKGQQNSIVFSDKLGKPLLQGNLKADLAQVMREHHLGGSLTFASLGRIFVYTLIKRRVPLTTMQKILGHDDILESILQTPLLFGADENHF